MLKRITIIGLSCASLFAQNSFAQDRLYPNEFSLGAVELLKGPFQHARDLNIQVLLEYDVDRLLVPYLKEAGLETTAESYPNWQGLDGHIGGHYLTAMAINYAATQNPECKKRMDYMVETLKACQEANTKTHQGWGAGYVGGVPNSEAIWSDLKAGNFSAYRSAWVPWYNLHKTYAGLRDAWVYAGNVQAKEIFLDFCDWGIDISEPLTDEQMEAMLDTEHGGMNESFADAYQITGDEKYLTAAKRFSHRALLDPLSSGVDNLDNMHANTQVPKAVGFQRIAELDKEEKYEKSGRFFWETVTTNRTLAFGGNSRREFFPSVTSCSDFIHDVEGPESCNSYNMLKLTEDLFRVNPKGAYMDYYERTLYNHILSTQHPEHGGYVYFTPTRPQHYRVYSSPNQGMWCCVGSGMENHGKYNQMIYTHTQDSLFLNLFIASALTWKEKGVTIQQQTNFPSEEQTTLKVTEGKAAFTLMIRYPGWVLDGALEILVNGKSVSSKRDVSSYVGITRKWKKGDEVTIKLPMQNSLVPLPNVPNYMAMMHGPILLAAKTGKEDLIGLVADDGRWAHIASGEKLPIDKAPIIVEDDIARIPAQLKKVDDQQYDMSQLTMLNAEDLVLEPFYQLHDSRYMMYWMVLTNDGYESYLDSIATIEGKKIEIQKRTIDFVAPGEQQPEADHAMHVDNSNTGNKWNEFWRDARDGGHFSYELATNGEKGLSLQVRYWGAEWGNRKFDIYIDDKRLITEENTGRWNQSQFIDVIYDIPDLLVDGKDQVRIKFQALPKNSAGAVFYLRLLRKG